MLRPRFLLLFTLFALGFPIVAGADCMGPYPPSMIKAFNQNCAKDAPQTLPFCSCIIDEVQKNIPLADFIEIGNSAAGINSDPRFIKASKKCSPQLSSSTPVPNAAPAVSTGSTAVITQGRDAGNGVSGDSR